jgi:thioester reductase-like protein
MVEALAEQPQGDTILVTGFPSYLVRRLVSTLLASRPGCLILILHDPEAGPVLRAFLATLPEAVQPRVQPLPGNVAHLDLGLTSEQYRRLVSEATEIQHVAACFQGPGDRLRKINVGGTQEVVELAGQCSRLRRLVHWSTVLVSGTHTGVFEEEDLECGQRFRSAYEQARYEAERLVRRAARKLPVTVVRPGLVLGDSRTGELEAYEGPHRLVAELVASPRERPVLLPGSGHAPVPIVPVDHVVEVAAQVSASPAGEGKTFHLVDPAPPSASRFYQLLARKAHRAPFPGRTSGALSRLLALAPRLGRHSPVWVAPPAWFDHLVFYSPRNTLDFTAGTGPACPPFEAYVEKLVRYAQATARTARMAAEEQVPDPLA